MPYPRHRFPLVRALDSVCYGMRLQLAVGLDSDRMQVSLVVAPQVDRPPDIDARNASGDTIRELAATATAHASRYGTVVQSFGSLDCSGWTKHI